MSNNMFLKEVNSELVVGLFLCVECVKGKELFFVRLLSHPNPPLRAASERLHRLTIAQLSLCFSKRIPDNPALVSARALPVRFF